MALATNAALLRRSGSELNAEVGAAPAVAHTTPQAQAQHPAPSSSQALIHALECLQNKIKAMEIQKAAVLSDFESQRTRSAGELADMKLLCSRQEQELAGLRRQADDHIDQARAGEQAAVDAWEKTGVLNAALARANAQVEQVSQQLEERDEELAAMREQLSRASDAVSNAGSRAAEYSDRVTETVSELSHARAELHAARLEAEAAQARATAAERMLQELRGSAAASAAAEENERARAEYASASLRSILNLSAHAAAELPHELQHGFAHDARSWMADPLAAAAQLSESQPEPRPEPDSDRWFGQHGVKSDTQSFSDRVSLPGSSALDPPSSDESSVSRQPTAAAMAASAAAAAAAAARRMGPRIPGLPGYYLDVQAKLDPKYKHVRDRAEKIVNNSKQIWVPAGPALSDGRHAPSSPKSRHGASIHTSVAPGASSPNTKASKARKPKGRRSCRPASAPARHPRAARAAVAAAMHPSTPRAKRKSTKASRTKHPKQAGMPKGSSVAKAGMRKRRDPHGDDMNVDASETVEARIAALATACGEGEPDQRRACERLIATTRAEIDVS